MTAGAYWPNRSWIKSPGTIKVSIGPLLHPQGQDPRAIVDLNARCFAFIEQLWRPSPTPVPPACVVPDRQAARPGCFHPFSALFPQTYPQARSSLGVGGFWPATLG